MAGGGDVWGEEALGGIKRGGIHSGFCFYFLPPFFLFFPKNQISTLDYDNHNK